MHRRSSEQRAEDDKGFEAATAKGPQHSKENVYAEGDGDEKTDGEAGEEREGFAADNPEGDAAAEPWRRERSVDPRQHRRDNKKRGERGCEIGGQTPGGEERPGHRENTSN